MEGSMVGYACIQMLSAGICHFAVRYLVDHLLVFLPRVLSGSLKNVAFIFQVKVVSGRVDSVLDLCLIDTGLNPAKAGQLVTTVGKLFTPTVPSGAEGRLNQLTAGTADTSLVTRGKLFTCVISGLLSLSSLIGG